MESALKKVINKKLLSVIVLVNVLILIRVLSILNPKFPDINLEKILSYNKEYALSPMYNNGLISPISIKYPYVQTPPWDFRYFYIPIKEVETLKIKKYNHLFFSEKRIAELLMWGDKIGISILPENKISIDSLKSWGDKKKSNNYNLWEVAFARYIYHVEKEEDELISQSNKDYNDKSKDIVLLLSKLKTHNIDLRNYISSLNKKPVRKKYLLKLNDIVYSYLKNRISDILPLYNPHELYIPTSDIIREKEYGVYDVIISNLPDTINSSNKAVLKYKDKVYFPSVYNKQENEVLYKNVQISNKIKNYYAYKNLVLQLPKINLTNNISWIKYPLSDTAFYFDVKNESDHATYYLKFKSEIKNFFRLKFEKQYETSDINGKKSKRLDIYIDQPFNTDTDKSNIFETLIQLNNNGEKTSSFHLSLESSIPLQEENLQSISIDLIPMYDAVLTMKRIPEQSLHNLGVHSKKINSFIYNLVVKGGSLTEENYIIGKIASDWTILSSKNTDQNTKIISFIYKPMLLIFYAWVWFNSLFISFVLYLLLRNIYKSNQQRLINYFRKIHSFINKYFSVAKFSLPFIIFIGILVDVLWNKPYSDLIVVFITACWIIVLILYKFDSRSSFLLALICLILSPFFALKKLDGVAEKLGVWSFEFLIIGSFQSIIEIRYLSHKQYFSFKKMLKRIRHVGSVARKLLIFPVINPYFKKLLIRIKVVELLGLIKKLFSKIIRFFSLFITHMDHVLNITFSYRPRTLRDYLITLLRVVFITTVILSFYFVYQKTYFFFQNIQKEKLEKQKKESINPQIAKVEPQIVYFATKVIIYGQHFGWKEYGKVQLLTKKEKVATDLWTDTKIIFTVPLHWKPGEIKLFLEKKETWKRKSIIVKSKTMTLKLIPRSNTFTSNDDAYFEQLKSLTNETLRLNGYKPEDYR